MDIEISTEFDNRLLLRKELDGIVQHPMEPTPTREAVRSRLAALHNVEKERVIVIGLHSRFGIGETHLTARIYDTPSQALRVEPNYILKRNGVLGEQEEDN